MASVRLWGGIFVAMPTAMPLEPFTSRFGKRLGSTRGSLRDSSKFGSQSTVSFSRSRSISFEIFERRAWCNGRQRGIAVDGAEVAVAVDEHIAHGEVLRQTHERIIDRRVAVRMIAAQHVADAGRGL